jgi:hypothetical protein
MDNVLKRLDTPLAKELAESYILQHDMKTSIRILQIWQEKFAEKATGSEERLIGQSLFRDAIVQFVGCFDKTASFPLSAEAIYGHDPNGLASFQWFKDMRDCYAAHKFGAQRQCVVGVIHKDDGTIGIGQISAILRGQRKDKGPEIIRFMQTAANVLDNRVAQLEVNLMGQVQTMTPDEINELSPAAVRPADQHESGMSRSQIRKAIERDPSRSSYLVFSSSRQEKEPRK